MKLRVLCILSVVAAGLTVPAAAQFSTDIPGVPRASVPLRGGHQNRTTWNFAFYSIGPDSTGTTNSAGALRSDTLMFAGRLGFGQSYRIGARLEVGFDLTVADGVHVRPPAAPSSGSTSRSAEPASFSSGVFLDAARVGAKYRPIQVLSPEGYGFEGAIGVAYQPALQPVYAVVMDRDSLQSGGLLRKPGEGQAPLLAESPAAYQVAGMFSYRARRFAVDAAAIYDGEVETGDSATAGASRPTGSKLNPRIGAQFRLTPGIAVGASWWGKGASPWSGRTSARLPEEKESYFTPFVTFGSTPEAGLDVLVVTPTGNFRESTRLYLRARSTR